MLTDIQLDDEQVAWHPVTGLPVLETAERRKLDRPFQHWIDPNTHHWPGCGSRHADCTCFFEPSDASEFALALRDGDRAIAAMVMDTGRTPADADYPTNTSVHVTIVERVMLRPGLYIDRPSQRYRALTGSPPAHIVGNVITSNTQHTQENQ